MTPSFAREVILSSPKGLWLYCAILPNYSFFPIAQEKRPASPFRGRKGEAFTGLSSLSGRKGFF
jgi:hypothetical protein